MQYHFHWAEAGLLEFSDVQRDFPTNSLADIDQLQLVPVFVVTCQKDAFIQIGNNNADGRITDFEVGVVLEISLDVHHICPNADGTGGHKNHTVTNIPEFGDCLDNQWQSWQDGAIGLFVDNWACSYTN